MATIWVRRRHDPEHAEIKVVVGRDGHISDVLEKAGGVLVFESGRRVAGGLCAVADGRVLSNKEPATAWDNRSLIIQERTDVMNTSSLPPQTAAIPHIHEMPHIPQHQQQLHNATQHTCAKCHQPILGLKVVLTLPGKATAVDLHPDCELDFERQNALQCAHCTDLILDRLTTLTGDFGTINLHPQCVDSYKKSPTEFTQRGSYHAPNPSSFQTIQPQIASSVGGGGGGVVGYNTGMFTCAHCRSPIEGTKVALKLPGFQHKADLHPQCEYQYSVSHALKCDFCQQPMLDGITVLTGDFDSRSVQLHPTCVNNFKQSHSGHAPWGGGGGSMVSAPSMQQQAHYTPSSTQWRPVESAPPTHGNVRWATTSG